jgi:hypothetical protein
MSDHKISDLYEYTLHDETDNTLQVFTMNTMDSTYFSAKQTLDLLNFLQSHRSEIEEKAKQQAEQRATRKSVQDRIDNLFS